MTEILYRNKNKIGSVLCKIKGIIEAYVPPKHHHRANCLIFLVGK